MVRPASASRHSLSETGPLCVGGALKESGSIHSSARGGEEICKLTVHFFHILLALHFPSCMRIYMRPYMMTRVDGADVVYCQSKCNCSGCPAEIMSHYSASLFTIS